MQISRLRILGFPLRWDLVRQIISPKADGSLRTLGIPTIRDRVAQIATKRIIEPSIEADNTMLQ